jgi:hypothetical protein
VLHGFQELLIDYVKVRVIPSAFSTNDLNTETFGKVLHDSRSTVYVIYIVQRMRSDCFIVFEILLALSDQVHNWTDYLNTLVLASCYIAYEVCIGIMYMIHKE